jgi:hypothetical protein
MLLHTSKRIFLLRHNPEARQGEAALEQARPSGIPFDFEAAAAVILAAHTEHMAARRMMANARRLRARIRGNRRGFRVKPYQQIAIRNGRHYGGWQKVRTEGPAAFGIVTRRPTPINADGEIVTATPVRFRVLPRAALTLHREPATLIENIMYANQFVRDTYLSVKQRNADHATSIRVEKNRLHNCGFDDCGFVRKLQKTRVPFIPQDGMKGG